jgi:16S rRNA (cytidine1402-2'-O)-methyltransferase
MSRKKDMQLQSNQDNYSADSNEDSFGTLYICATPIGNLEDITLRVLRILKEVDLIAAEDTRVTRKLLSYFEISTRITSFHEHNEIAKGVEIVKIIKKGHSVALVSDAGTPGISDPGHRLIKKCIEEGIPIEPLPGASSLVTALIVSGLPTDSFVFQGFMSRRKGERIKQLNELMVCRKTAIIFESPYRLAATLRDIAAIDPQRPTVVARELTKKFEEIIRGTASELYNRIAEYPVKGEIVLLIGATDEPVLAANAEISEGALRDEVIKRVNEGLSKKEAISAVARDYRIEKRRVYNATIKKKS